MKDFSLFDLAVELSSHSHTTISGDIVSISRRDFQECETLIFRTMTPGLEYASLLIENELLLRTNRAGRVYAGFEKFSSLQPIVDRYVRIADVSGSVYLFGEPDWQPPRHPNIRFVNLASDFKLARESFLIAESPTLSVALIGLDEDGFGVPAFELRNFTVIKSHKKEIVAKIVLSIEGMIDWSIAA